MKKKKSIPNSQTPMRKAHTHINEDAKRYDRKKTKKDEKKGEER